MADHEVGRAVVAADAEHGRAARSAREHAAPTSRLRDTWLLHRPQLLQLLLAYVVLTGAWVGMGELLTGPLRDGGIVATDIDVSRDLEAGRTPRWDDLTEIGTLLADTIVKVVVTAVIAVVMLAIWKRWREPLMMIVPLVLEASAFIMITVLVGRGRPDVERLESSPVDSSFPSGHAAAAACYTALAFVVAWHTRRRWVPWLAAVALFAVAVAVGYARMYRGMHFLSDVVAGVVLGLVSVVATWLILRQAPEGPFRLRRRDHQVDGR